MNLEKRAGQLVPLIYQAACDPTCWGDFLYGFAATVNASASAILCHDFADPRGCFSASIGFDPAWEQKYERYYAGLNIWIRRLQAYFRPGDIVTSDMVSNAELYRTEFYNDWLRPQGILYSFGGTVLREGSAATFLTAVRPPEPGPFAQEESALLSALMPHLQTAVRLHGRISSLESRLAAATQALDRMPAGIFIVDGAGKILLMNAAASHILERADGLSVSAGGLAAATAVETARLHRLIAGVTRTAAGKAAHPGGVMTLSRPSLGRDLQALIAPLPPQHSSLAAGLPAAVIFVTDPEEASEADRDLIGRIFGLTPAESRVAAGLAEGRSIEELAATFGVSEETVRTQLKRVYDKTDTNRQAELVSLLLRSPAALRGNRQA